MDGSQTHVISLARICSASVLKKSAMPIGETATGLNGKKYRVVSNGVKKAMPSPPSVIASRTPCDAVQRKRYTKIPACAALARFL